MIQNQKVRHCIHEDLELQELLQLCKRDKKIELCTGHVRITLLINATPVSSSYMNTGSCDVNGTEPVKHSHYCYYLFSHAHTYLKQHVRCFYLEIEEGLSKPVVHNGGLGGIIVQPLPDELSH